jgi:hypothetical protein
MTCERSSEIVVGLFDDQIGKSERAEFEVHVQGCAHCQAQVDDARLVQARLAAWQDELVPSWRRSAMVVPRPEPVAWRQRLGFWQWAPLACSFLLALGVILNVEFRSTTEGFVVAFGQSTGVSREEVQEQLTALAASFETRREEESLQMIETVLGNVMRQYDDNNSRNLEQVIEYFDLQRQQDLQLLQSGYQQLADSDYETIRSVQQLASYVQYQGLE